MKNILMLTTQLSMGGAEKVFYDHLKAFSERYNVKVCLFTKQGMNTAYSLDNELFELDDIAIPNPLKRWKYRRQRLRELIVENKIDVCISHMEGPNFLNGWTNIKGVKKIFVVHGSINNNSQKSNIDKIITNAFLIPKFYNRADYIVTVSEAIKHEHLCLGIKSSKVICINNFFDVHAITKKAVEKTVIDHVFENNKTLIHVGRSAPEKNQIFLLKLLKFFRENGRKEKLIIVGDGSLKTYLILQAAELGLKAIEYKQDELINETADVFFMGAQANPYKYMSKAKLFILTSFNEGFPLVLGESLACGTPVVSVDCPTGPREILSAPGEIILNAIESYKELYCGNLVKYFDKDGAENEDYLKIWLHAINSLLNDNVKLAQLRENCFIKAAEYDKAKIIQKWFDMIEA